MQNWSGCTFYDTLFYNTLTSIEVLSEILHARHTCNCYFPAISNKNIDLRNSEVETKLAIPTAFSLHFIC